jgi:hypothetical protein
MNYPEEKRVFARKKVALPEISPRLSEPVKIKIVQDKR